MTGNFTATVRGAGPGLLLAHGAGGSVDANFGPVLDDLARTHTVIGPDYPGSGAEVDAAVDDLAANLPPGSPEHVALGAAVDTRAELQDVLAPTLIVSTTSDALTGPSLSRELADGIPHADLVEVDAGHLIGDEAPGAWLAAIQRFLSGKKATA